ncbi:hypothetical protein ACFSLT_08430 [Novosphingobium resinovorum]
MQRRNRPAVDPSIAPQQGITRDGQPLSYNRAPAPDLAPWLGRLYVTKVDLPKDYTVSCGLFNDTACVRVQMAGTGRRRPQKDLLPPGAGHSISVLIRGACRFR